VIPASPAAPPVFEQVGTHPLYVLRAEGPAGLPGFWAGYCTGGSLGQVATLDQVWQDTLGTYLFCGQDPTPNAEAFLERLRTVLSSGTRMLWIPEPLEPLPWQVWRVRASATGSGAGIAWRVTAQAVFSHGSYAVTLAARAPLAQADPAALGYGIATGDGTLGLVAPGETYPAAPGSGWLPLAGEALGSWAGDLELRNGGEDGQPDDLSRLGVQLRYAVPGGAGGVRAISMPILRQGGTHLTGHLTFDPIHPEEPGRTGIGLVPPPGRRTTARQPLDSSLRSALGYPVTLTPIAGPPPLRPARLVFCFSPVHLPAGGPGAAYEDFYLAPDGGFDLEVGPRAGLPPDGRLLLGLSGGEYVELGPQGTARVQFEAGRAAFAPGALPPGTPGGHAGAPDEEPLTDLATTSYLAFLPPAEATGRPASGLTYYAQPHRSPWYAARAGSTSGFLDSHPLPTALLPAAVTAAAGVKALPVGAYAGLDEESADAAWLLEEAALAPARRAAIGLVTSDGAESGGTGAGGLVRVVTPQGLLADVDIGQAPGQAAWQRIVLASFPGTPVGELVLTGVGPHLRAAMQSSEVFFVVADPVVYMKDSSVRYRLDAVGLDLLAGHKVPQRVIDKLRHDLEGEEFETEEAFLRALPEEARDYADKIREVAGLLKAFAEDWTFQLSPRAWRTGDWHPTMMLVKFAGRSLAQLVADPAAWGWREAAGDLEATQGELDGLLRAAREAPADSPYARFYREVAADPAWNGVLFVNAPVSAADLPKDLQFVTAGIDPDAFYAHHVGFSLTSVEVKDGAIRLGQTATFGLLHYEDLADLVLDSDVPLAFKTQRLSVRFAGGVIADMTAQVELMINRLFGDQLTMNDPEHGNNVVLSGAYQRQHGVPSYAFTLARRAEFSLSRSVLTSIEVLGAGLQTAVGSVAEGRVAVDFVLSGRLRFAEIESFDLFSYGAQELVDVGAEPKDGYLAFSGLTVRMRFDVDKPQEQEFGIDEASVAIDLEASKARPGSLAEGFPVGVSGLIAVAEQPGEPASRRDTTEVAIGPRSGDPAARRPEDLGYTSVLAPLDQVPLDPPWYGLTMTLDLGTLGALAGSAGLTVSLLAGWSPGRADDRPVFLGIQLASAGTSGVTWPVQGVLRLGFRSFEFAVSEAGERREYLLLLRHLALSVLGWSVPPGELTVVLFGNPDKERASSLGWYAAYVKDKPAGAGTVAATGQARRLRSGRRAPALAAAPGPTRPSPAQPRQDRSGP
jgi:hypothetical protein